MGDNNINISGLDFTKLPDDWKIKVNLDNVSGSTMNALNKIDGVDISDDINKNEAELIIMAINTDENASEIDMDEINKFCSENNIAKSGGIEGIISNIVTNSREKLEPQQDNFSQEDNIDSTQAANEDDNTTDETKANNQDDSSSIKINIQKWGSTADDGNKYANDCLSHIIANNYPDLKPYSQEWFDKELEIMNANPEIYGTVDENGNVSGARHSVSGTDRHNATLYESDELVLPGIKVVKYVDQTDTNSEADNGVKTDNGNGTYTMTYKNEGGNTTKEENYDKNGILTNRNEYEYSDSNTKTKETNTKFENGIEKEITVTLFEEDGTTVKTQTITNYKEDGKSVTEIDNNNHSKIITDFNKDDVKTKEIKLIGNENHKVEKKIITEFNEDGTANITENKYDDGTLTEETKGEIDTSGKKTEEIVYTYDKEGNITTVTENKYDINGNIIMGISKDPSDLTKELSITENEFDNNNNKTKTIQYINKILDSIINYTYDDSGNIKTETINRYNEDNADVAYMTTERTYSDNGDYIEKTIKVDENGEYTIIEYNKDGSTKGSEKRYDKDGNEIAANVK